MMPIETLSNKRQEQLQVPISISRTSGIEDQALPTDTN